MKKKLFLIILFIFVLICIMYLQDKALGKHVTVEEVKQYFVTYETVVQDFFKDPSEVKIEKVYKAEDEFTKSYFSLATRDKRFYEKILHINPIPSENELAELKGKYSLVADFNKQIENIAITEVFKANDFSKLLQKAKEIEYYQDEDISIKVLDEGQYLITIDGSFNTDIVRNYFIIKSENGNYFWKSPNPYSIQYRDQELTIHSGGVRYKIITDLVQ
ncbi:hypothetical protein [Bacillus sp. AK128]